MNIIQNKTLASLIALFLILAIAVPLTIPAVSGAVSYHTSYIFVSSSAKLLGIGQQTIIIAWTSDIVPDIGEASGAVAAANNRAGWDGVTVNVTRPDGAVDVLAMPRTDPIGSTWYLYTPEIAGNYTVQAFFPETWKNSTISDTQNWFSAAQSPLEHFTVQNDQVQNWVETPLTNDYWTRPLNGANRNWYPLAGDWLGTSSGETQYPLGGAGGTSGPYSYSQGPESAHILWTKPYWAGGIMDSFDGNTGYETAHYQGLSFSAVILDGKLHYQPRYTAHTAQGWEVVDLYSGATMYLNYSDTMPSFGQVYNYESPNQHGGFPYLYRTVSGLGSANGTVWEMLDGYTQQHITMIANVSGGTAVYGLDGSLLRYSLANKGSITNPDSYITVWNSSAIPQMLGGTLGNTGYWQWRPVGGSFGGDLNRAIDYNRIFDGSTGYSANFSIQGSVYAPISSLLNQTMTLRDIRQDQYAIFGCAGRNDERGNVPGYFMAVSLDEANLGAKLWDSSLTAPYGATADNLTITLAGIYPEDGVILYKATKTLTWWAYDMKTGAAIWQTGPEIPQFSYYDMAGVVYQGNLITEGYGGQLIAYNMTNGDISWTYSPLSVGFETPYGYYPTGVGVISGDKLYTVSSEHSPTQPLYRGPNLRCINATDGSDVWKILFYGAGMSPTSSNIVMADGILIGLNYFDMELYAFGRGPSGTTVTAPQTISALGSSVMITGTVTDQTQYGKRNTNDAFDFTLKDTPAISDNDMASWMEYLFEQQAKPSDAAGVPVSVDAVDPNGNFVHIGDTTSDMNGNYGLPFTADVPGTYQVIATFAGSKAYGPSSASTYMAVGEAPTSTAEPTATPASMADMYLVPSTVGIIVAIAVATVIIVLALRKRP